MRTGWGTGFLRRMLFSIVTALARVRRAKRRLKELGIFFTFMATLPAERARIPAFIDLCRASFYPDPLCIEVFYLVHYLAHPRLQPGMVPGGKHSARNGWVHFFFVVVILFERAWMQFFRILPIASSNHFRKENHSFRFIGAQLHIIIFALTSLLFAIINYRYIYL